ncbi:MAG TPA: prepilin-type N-terminal cleavage/methylation domain-containing protein [Candidatus Saccharimonadia bacterium]|nr:prepilin-type N-terminal cleavage/methylation domain-containing protein [Candidatus Saccharimonadia bacterium]
MAKLRSSAARQFGFTLIEIVLVLAIAALLLVVVFLAVSGAQRARRDAQRKQDAAQFAAAVVTYAGNNKLQPPADNVELDNLVTQYFANHSDPSTGTQYVGDYHNNGTNHTSLVPPAFGHIAYVQGHVCGSDPGPPTIIKDPPFLGPSTRQFVVVIRLESGTDFCVDGEY